VIKRIILFDEEETILEELVRKKSENNVNIGAFDSFSLDVRRARAHCNLIEIGKRAAETAEKEMIKNTLLETHWNRKATSKLLRVSYKALINKIQKYHLNELNKQFKRK